MTCFRWDRESCICCGGWQNLITGQVLFHPGGERIWIRRGCCWAMTLMAFLLKSVNLVDCIIEFLLTLKQPHSTKTTRCIACPLRGSVRAVRGRLFVCLSVAELHSLSCCLPLLRVLGCQEPQNQEAGIPSSSDL